MPNQNTFKSFVVALLFTVAIGIAALLIALAVSLSGTSDNGISAYAGGISQRFVNFLLLALPVVFIFAFFISRKMFK